jgi:serine/threonine protein kinase
MVAARRAVARLVESLTARDRFAILAFDNVVEGPSFETPLVPADAYHRTRAVEYLFSVNDRGGTEMLAPLTQAASLLHGRRGSFFKAETKTERSIVLLTDGQVGNEDQIVQKLGAEKNLRVCTVGIDSAVNASFLLRLAQIGGGRCELVESEAKLHASMDNLARLLLPPVLTQLSLVPGGFAMERDSLAPERLPDLFAGAPVQILGRFQGEPMGRLVLRGVLGDGSAYQQELAISWEEEAPLSTLWARARLRDLEDRYTIGEQNRSALEQQIVSVSTRFQVLCRFTAFVAVDWEQIVNEEGEQRRVTQAVETPSGWDELDERKKSKPATFNKKAKMRGGFQEAKFSKDDLAQIDGSRVLYEREEAKPARGRMINLSAPASAAPPAPRATPPVLSPAPARVARSVAPGAVSSPSTGAFAAVPPAPSAGPGHAGPRIGQRAQSNRNLTQTGTITGDLHYFSPEQARGEVLTAASDVFAIGLLFYELLTGNALYQRESSLAALQAILVEPLPDFSQDPRTAPFAGILARLLAKNPADRFPSVVEALAALQQVATTDQSVWLELRRACDEDLRRLVAQHAEIAQGTIIADLGDLRLVASRENAGEYEEFLGLRLQVPTRPQYIRVPAPHVNDPSALADFAHEASFSHEGTVSWRSADIPGGRRVLLRPASTGVTLRTALDRSATFRGEQAAQVLANVCEGLVFALQQGGQLHGKLTPEAVWLDLDQNRAQVGDFGPAVQGQFRPLDISQPEAGPRANPPFPMKAPNVPPTYNPPPPPPSSEPPKKSRWKFWK